MTEDDFQILYGKQIPHIERCEDKKFTIHCTIKDIKNSWVGKILIWYAERTLRKTYGQVDYNNLGFKMAMESVINMPLIRASLMSQGKLPPYVVHAIIDLANGNLFKGLGMMIKQ